MYICLNGYTNMLTKGLDIDFKDVDLKQGIIKMQFAKHGTKDLHGDIGEYGMFSKSIQERGPKSKRLIKFLIDHKKDEVPGVITDLYENQDGGFVEAKAGSHLLGQDFLKMVESEIFNQASYGYSVIKEMFDHEVKANRLKEVMLYEVSAIKFLGANPEAGIIEVKSLTEALQYVKNLQRFVRTSNATDETLEKLELELKSLLKTLKPSDDTLNEKKADERKLFIENLKNSFESWKTN